jgi:1-deoxy-D-xylulose-5-phosphate reductoisomerase
LIHGIAEFQDGTMIAQLAAPDMRLPIQLGLGFPDRLVTGIEPLDLAAVGRLTFEPLDRQAFPALELAYRAGQLGGTFPAVMNAANEVAVSAFLDGRLGLTAIPEVAAAVVDEHEPPKAVSLVTLERADAWARRRAVELLDSR